MKMRKDLITLTFIITIGIVAMGIVLARTGEENYSAEKPKEKSPERIHLLEYSFKTSLYIVEVDGHEYLVENEGGIYHLESCPCKNK